MTSFAELLFNPRAGQVRAYRSAGYVTGALFVLGISAWYLLKCVHVEFAKRSFRIAAAFGFAGPCRDRARRRIRLRGDRTPTEPSWPRWKGMWKTEAAPAPFTLFAIPDDEKRENAAEIKLPYLLGLIATRSTDKVLPGIDQLEAQALERIQRGVTAVKDLESLRAGTADAGVKARFESHKDDLGYGLLLKKYVADVAEATPEMMAQAARDTIPKVAPMFWTFRIMVVLGFAMLALVVLAFCIRPQQLPGRRWLLRWALWFIPCRNRLRDGWFVAEYGRQPWTIFGCCPPTCRPPR
jgi:cytochrome d ubiquinol oxidase subunit I